jgi:hypothetical protein
MTTMAFNESMHAVVVTTASFFIHTTAIADNELKTHSTAFVSTNATADSSLTSVVQPDLWQWKRLLDTKLMNWGRDAHLPDDDAFERPTKASVNTACHLVQQFLQMGSITPTRLTPNGDGGVSFEWELGEHLIQVEVLKTGRLRRIYFVGSQMVSHHGFNV